MICWSVLSRSFCRRGSRKPRSLSSCVLIAFPRAPYPRSAAAYPQARVRTPGRAPCGAAEPPGHGGQSVVFPVRGTQLSVQVPAGFSRLHVRRCDFRSWSHSVWLLWFFRCVARSVFLVKSSQLLMNYVCPTTLIFMFADSCCLSFAFSLPAFNIWRLLF